jgi:hypothetical protein
MMSPAQPQGSQEGSRIDVMMATKLLERSLSVFGTTSEEGQAILKCLSTLGKKFGKSQDETSELMPAELKHMIAAASGPGNPNPSGGGAPPGGPQQ